MLEDRDQTLRADEAKKQSDGGKKERIVTGITVFIAFLIYFSLSCMLPMEKAPDESMRYMVPEYIFQYHRLPAGTDMAVVDGVWGFSYAFTPYLPSILAAMLMRLAAVFTDSAKVLLIACRFVSVAAATGSVWLAFPIGKRLFADWKSRLLFALCVGFLPQFVFLSAYLNNDAFAVFTVMLILFAWLYGRERHWDYRSCLLLAVAIGLCVLTYYNAYGWVLCSIFMFFGSIWQDDAIERKWKHALSHGCMIAAVAFLLGGWFFIRNAVLYDGDFLGMDTMYECGELHAAVGYKPSERLLYAKAGLPVWSMLLDTEWIPDTLDSFFAVFGYRDIRTLDVIYVIYLLLAIVGLLGFVYGFCRKKEMRREWLLYGCCFLCMLIPLVLSIRYSYAIDYQAQGRYLMSALPALALFMAKGCQALDEIGKRKKKMVTLGMTTVWLLLFFFVFVTVMVPHLYVGIQL